MRASEVFELPVASGGMAHDEDDIFQADGNGVWCATFCSDEQAKVAARAINHADALADSLESVLCTIKHLHYKKWLDDECDESVTFKDSASYSKMERCFGDEIAALEAYRGAK